MKEGTGSVTDHVYPRQIFYYRYQHSVSRVASSRIKSLYLTFFKSKASK